MRPFQLQILPIMAACSALLLACSDLPPTMPTSTSEQSTKTNADPRTRLRHRNPSEWVGLAHNQAVDDFRSQALRATLLSSDRCRTINEFAAAEARVPVGHRIAVAQHSGIALEAVERVDVCGKRSARKSSQLSILNIDVALMSATAANLAATIEYSIDAAADAYDLAQRLNAVLDASYSLDLTERAAIAASVSVAQNSFEYWQYNYVPLRDEVFASCRALMDDVSGSSCYASGYYSYGTVSADGTALYGTEGGGTGIGNDIRSIVRADARGAFTGGFTAAVAAFGATGPNPVTVPDAAALGAIAGGAANSIATGIGIVMEAYCKMMCKR